MSLGIHVIVKTTTYVIRNPCYWSGTTMWNHFCL